MWTTEEEVLARLRKRWATGEWLAALARGETFQPVRIPLTAPKPADLERSFGEVQEWARRWRQVDPERLRVEYKRVGGRRVGSNEVPYRVWVDTFERLCALLRVRAETQRFRWLLAETAATDPRLLTWVARHPMRALELVEEWPRLLAALRWIRDCPDPGRRYLRQIDAPGVDTKFVESHRRTLAGLLDLVLPEERVATETPVSSFADRYGFATKPDYTRFRLLGGQTVAGYTELSVRTSEFRVPAGVETVFIVENEITFLAFPDHPDAMVLLGGGYAVALAARAGDLRGRRVVYWGDIDTHGLAILDRLRAHLPHATSMLMDEATLLGHREHWSSEPNPTSVHLPRLTSEEARVYAGLTTDQWGRAVRLEQERVRFSHLAATLDGLDLPKRAAE